LFHKKIIYDIITVNILLIYFRNEGQIINFIMFYIGNSVYF